MKGKSYLTTAETADYLRLKERTIYELAAKKVIPCSRVTGKLMFPRHLIDRWIEANIEIRGPRLNQAPPIMAGSSDPLLEWTLRASNCGLAALFEGSEAGLERFAHGQALAAGVHIMGPGGAYNADAVRALAQVFDLVLIQFAKRGQGIIAARGNPLQLATVQDLVLKHPRVIARQPGAGTQKLLEILLQQAGYRLTDVALTAAPALSETDVAIAVADGQADCGMAIGAAARRFGLDFIPLHQERFDIVCRRRDFFEPALQQFFAAARAAAFTEKAAQLGYYDVSETGRVEFNA